MLVSQAEEGLKILRGSVVPQSAPFGRRAPLQTPLSGSVLARGLQSPDPGTARAVLASLESAAIDLGNNGLDPTYGKGLVGADLRAGRRE